MKLTTCPACGRPGLARVVEEVTFDLGPNKKKVVEDVPHYRCRFCGEKVFDRESNRLLDAHRGKRRARGAA
jgi:YgiT-type zinc finger domain-containing protein